MDCLPREGGDLPFKEDCLKGSSLFMLGVKNRLLLIDL